MKQQTHNNKEARTMKTGDLIRTSKGEAQITLVRGDQAAVITTNIHDRENTGVIDLTTGKFVGWGSTAYNKFIHAE